MLKWLLNEERVKKAPHEKLVSSERIKKEKKKKKVMQMSEMQWKGHWQRKQSMIVTITVYSVFTWSTWTDWTWFRFN